MSASRQEGARFIGPLPPSRDGRTAHSPGPAQGHGNDHGHASCRDGDGPVLRPLDRVGDDDPSQGPDDHQRVRRVPALVCRQPSIDGLTSGSHIRERERER